MSFIISKLYSQFNEPFSFSSVSRDVTTEQWWTGKLITSRKKLSCIAIYKSPDKLHISVIYEPEYLRNHGKQFVFRCCEAQETMDLVLELFDFYYVWKTLHWFSDNISSEETRKLNYSIRDWKFDFKMKSNRWKRNKNNTHLSRNVCKLSRSLSMFPLFSMFPSTTWTSSPCHKLDPYYCNKILQMFGNANWSLILTKDLKIKLTIFNNN